MYVCMYTIVWCISIDLHGVVCLRGRALRASPHVCPLGAAWVLWCAGGEAHGAGGKVTMLADPHLHLTKALGITLDAEGLLGTKR